ncbi:MAG: Holliday junction resolvase RuvX [Candidatus Bipolaricaulota bacterium]|nr:Holliday junction resolvase RuvX [Candidatus Bipolaricaulota bacterium]
MRTLGIDYGRRRLGLAISDEGGILASPLPVYERQGEKKDLTFLSNLASEREAGRIVLGLPLNMDGSSGEMADEVVAFAEALREESGLPVVTFDERLTSVEAERVLVQANLSRKRRKGLRDSLSAVLILQGYLESLRGARVP